MRRIFPAARLIRHIAVLAQRPGFHRGEGRTGGPDERLPPVSERQPLPGRNRARLLAHIAVVTGVVALAAAAFVLSYAGVHQIALSAGVPATLARLYPAIFDAVLVVACAAALTLREARWWTRCYAWLSVLALVALIGAADASHAMGVRLPHRIAAGTVAALPWALVMLGFSLWLSMLRYARGGRTPAAVAKPADSGRAASAGIAITGARGDNGAVRAVPPPLPVRTPGTGRSVPRQETARQATVPAETPASEPPAAAGRSPGGPEPVADPEPTTERPPVPAKLEPATAERPPTATVGTPTGSGAEAAATADDPGRAPAKPGQAAAGQATPAEEPASAEKNPPGAAAPPVRFERVRSTPTPPRD